MTTTGQGEMPDSMTQDGKTVESMKHVPGRFDRDDARDTTTALAASYRSDSSARSGSARIHYFADERALQAWVARRAGSQVDVFDLNRTTGDWIAREVLAQPERSAGQGSSCSSSYVTGGSDPSGTHCDLNAAHGGSHEGYDPFGDGDERIQWVGGGSAGGDRLPVRALRRVRDL